MTYRVDFYKNGQRTGGGAGLSAERVLQEVTQWMLTAGVGTSFKITADRRY